MKVSSMAEDRLKAQYAEQLHKLGFTDTYGMTLYQLASRLGRERRVKESKQINHDSPDSAWFD